MSESKVPAVCLACKREFYPTAQQVRQGNGKYCSLPCAQVVDIAGTVFGSYTVLMRNGHIGKHAAWLCRCVCGLEKTVSGSGLRRGTTTSCGCVRTARIRRLGTTHGAKRNSRTFQLGEYA